jgi:hypothetical protein
LHKTPEISWLAEQTPLPEKPLSCMQFTTRFV